MWFVNIAEHASPPNQPPWRAGWEWPAGSGKTLCWYSSLLYGGYFKNKIQTGGTAFDRGLQGGAIFDSLVAPDSNHVTTRIWHIKRGDELTGSNPDYNNWPGQFGAPTDANGKPLFLGDEQLWFVSNDLDSLRMQRLFGSNPIGIETHTTAWGLHEASFLGDVIYVKNILINKSSDSLQDAYIGLWQDLGIGDESDDFGGVDTILNLTYQFNGEESDDIYFIPPAAGTVMLQTPLVPSMDDSAFALGRTRTGYRQSSISGFQMILNNGADPIYGDPYLGNYTGSIELYRLFQGNMTNGLPHIDPTTNQTVQISFAGDPIREKGWIDGILHIPDERRYLTSYGPYQIAPGDTQEVVYAYIAHQGRDRIHSLDKLKEYAGIIRNFYHHQKYLHTTPSSYVTISYPEQGKFTLHMDVIDTNAVAGKAVIVNINDSLIAEVPLFDDGSHEDGNASDHHWAAQWTANTIRNGVDVFFDVTDPDGFTYRLHGGRRIPVAGEVRTTDYAIVSDHLNMDGKVSAGENVRITLDVRNNTLFPIGDLSCNRLDGSIPTNDIYDVTDTIHPSGLGRREYRSGDERTYITVQIPDSASVGSRYWVRFRIQDRLYNRWEDSVGILIEEYTNHSTDSLIAHVAGLATGTLGIRILRSNEWKDRRYRVTIKDSIYHDSFRSRYILVHDLFDKTTIRAPLPDWYAHDMPVIDGFRLTLGTANNTLTHQEFDDWYDVILPENFYIPKHHAWFESTIVWVPGIEFFGSALNPFDLLPIRIEFSSANQQSAYVYERGGNPNYRYAGFGTVPFRVFDIRDSLNPRQLNVAFIEQSGSPRQNLRWDPKTSSDREYLFIFASIYSDTEDPRYSTKRFIADAGDMDILYASWYFARDSVSAFTEGDQWFIIPTVPISERDTFIVNLKGKLTAVRNAQVAKELSLGQNYPNPFNPSTTIPYSIPRYGHVRLSIKDVLGRTVATLIDETQAAGYYEMQWDARDVVSGVYMVDMEMEGVIVKRPLMLIK